MRPARMLTTPHSPVTIQRLLSVEDAPLGAAEAADPLIELDGLSRWYGRQLALREVTWRLPAGPLGLLGPNGPGKSTLLKILLGLLPPSSGRGRILGHDLGRAGTRLRRAIGYMPEVDALIPGLRGADYVALAG